MVEDYVEQHPIIDAIKQHFIDMYCLEYNKGMRLYLDGDSYSIYFLLNKSDKPIMIGGQFESDADFIEYIKKELRTKQLHRIKYFIANEANKPLMFTIGCADPNLENFLQQFEHEHNTQS